MRTLENIILKLGSVDRRVISCFDWVSSSCSVIKTCASLAIRPGEDSQKVYDTIGYA